MARIGIDLDGVCYDFAASLRQWIHQNRGGVTSDVSVCGLCAADFPNPHRWEFYKDWGFTTEEFRNGVREGVEAGVIFLWGSAHPGTKDALEALQDSGHNLVCVTDRVGLGGERAKRNTNQWILREGLWFDEVRFDADKTAYNCDYFVDDKLENYDALDAAGVKVYLWDRPWNQDDSKERRRVSSWEQFVACVGESEYTGLTVRPFTQEELDILDRSIRVPDLEPDPFLVPSGREFGEVRITSSTGGQKGQKLARLGSLDPLALLEVAKVAGFGEQKYDRLNYMKGYDWSLSFDAGQRHRLTFWGGEEDFDPESAICHLAHSAWQDLTLLSFFLRKLGTDDRYKKPEEAA